jgi:hypothetical protein
MTHRLVHVLVLLLLVGTSINAQQRADFSIKQNKEPRALSRTSLTQQSATELIREFLECCVISSRVFN